MFETTCQVGDNRQKNAEAADLAAQIPGERLLQLRVREGERMVAAELRVIEMDITQIMRVRSALLPAMAEIRSAPDFIAFASEHVDLCAEVLSVAITRAEDEYAGSVRQRWTAERIRALAGASFLQLAYAVLEVNADFFLLLPGLGAFAGPAKPRHGAGETPSTTSASADTPPLSATPSAASMPPSTARPGGNGKSASIA